MTQVPQPDLYVGVVIRAAEIDNATTQELFDRLVKVDTATLDIDGLRFTVDVTRLSQKGL